MSASTKRRRKPIAANVRKRAGRLVRFAQGWLNGVDSNIRHKRQAAARAQVDVVRVALNDIPGLIDDALSVNATKAGAKEIQRLRAAMVHAMDDCDTALCIGVSGRALTHVTAARTAIKAALEKK